MSWLVNILQRRILFVKQEQTPNPVDGSMKQTYQVLEKVWAGLDPVNLNKTYLSQGAAYIRDVQINDAVTHRVTVRKNPSIGITTEHDGVIKSDNFIVLLSSRTPNAGRLFRILSAAEIVTHGAGDDSHYQILVKEIGTFDTGRGVLS